MTKLPHKTPKDFRQALDVSLTASTAWQSLTPLARNEWICWIVSVKQSETRAKHIDRAITELEEGVRRPCCWRGCIHRTDKEVSSSVRGILGL